MENNKQSKPDLLFLLILALGVFARVWRYPAKASSWFSPAGIAG